MATWFQECRDRGLLQEMCPLAVGGGESANPAIAGYITRPMPPAYLAYFGFVLKGIPNPSSCRCHPNTGMTGRHHHIWLFRFEMEIPASLEFPVLSGDGLQYLISLLLLCGCWKNTSDYTWLSFSKSEVDLINRDSLSSENLRHPGGQIKMHLEVRDGFPWVLPCSLDQVSLTLACLSLGMSSCPSR